LTDSSAQSSPVQSSEFLLLASPVLLIGLGMSFAGPYVALFGRREIHMTPLELGLYLTLVSSSSILVSAALARISDRLPNRKWIVVLAMLATAVGFACLSFLRFYWLLVVCASVFLGLGAAAFPQLFALSRQQLLGVGAKNPERDMTSLRSIFSLAWVVGPIGGSLLLERLGFQGLFLGTAVCYLIAAVPVLFARTRPQPLTSSTVSTTLELQSSAQTVAVSALCFVLYNMAGSMGASWLPIHVTETLHGSTANVGFLVGFCAFLEIPVMLGFAFWRSRPSNQHMLVLCFALSVAYFVLVSSAKGLPLLIVAQAVRAVVIAISATIGMAYFQELMPGRPGTAMTLFSNTMNLGAMLAGIVAGAVVQGFGLVAVFVLCAALAGVAFSLFSFVIRRHPPLET
jgi:MFS transporter, SET family, sugar efflux transporter